MFTNKSKAPMVVMMVLIVLSLVIGFINYKQISLLDERTNEAESSAANQYRVDFESLDESKYQAVFLKSDSNQNSDNNAQVYFGKVSKINPNSIELTDIYYLRTEGDASLAKLGCELHGPDDLMVISRDDISFWENLKTSGQVTVAINEFKDNNPNGQKCPPVV